MKKKEAHSLPAVEPVLSPPKRWPSRTRLACCSVILLAGTLRLQAGLDDFWLDEIWTVALMEGMDSPAQIILDAKVVNNHFLNSFIVYSLGPQKHWLWYRLPAVVAGLGTVILAGFAGRRWGPWHAFAAILLTGLSFPLIQYSSEARGYAYVMFFAMLSFVIMQTLLQDDRPRWKLEILFGITAIVSFLAHLTYVYCFAALGAWLLYSGKKFPPATLVRRALLGFGPPTLFVGWLYFVSLQTASRGGGKIEPFLRTTSRALSLIVGGPEMGPSVTLFATFAGIGLFSALCFFYRRREWTAVFFAGVVVAFPAAAVIVLQPEFLYARYFLVSILFAQLLFAFALGSLAETSNGGKWVYIATLLFLTITNTTHTKALLETGRGQYLAAARLINEQATSLPVSIGTDHPFRNQMVLSYYWKWIRQPKPLRFYSKNNWPQQGPEWLLRHSMKRNYDPPSVQLDFYQNRYRLVKVFPYAGLSGWHWGLYRKEAFTQPAPPSLNGFSPSGNR